MNRYILKPWVHHWGIYDTQNSCFVGDVIDFHNDAKLILQWFNVYLKDIQ